MVLTLPCSATIELASFSGIVLDSANFLALVWLGCTKPSNTILWRAITAFGFHLLYLLTFIGVQKWTMIDEIRGTFRLSGMLFNIIASEIFLRLVQYIHYGNASFFRKVSDLASENEIISIWTKNGLIIKGFNGLDPKIINPFDPYTTGYTTISAAMINSFIPIFGTCIISSYNDNYWQLNWSILCAFCFKTYIPKYHEKYPNDILVFTWNHIRFLYQIIAIIIALTLAYN
tara:strand:+ start:42 stop:734 length:693 start_codon:yes stop_codon:yes gene_type:complete